MPQPALLDELRKFERAEDAIKWATEAKIPLDELPEISQGIWPRPKYHRIPGPVERVLLARGYFKPFPLRVFGREAVEQRPKILQEFVSYCAAIMICSTRHSDGCYRYRSQRDWTNFRFDRESSALIKRISTQMSFPYCGDLLATLLAVIFSNPREPTSATCFMDCGPICRKGKCYVNGVNGWEIHSIADVSAVMVETVIDVFNLAPEKISALRLGGRQFFIENITRILKHNHMRLISFGVIDPNSPPVLASKA